MSGIRHCVLAHARALPGRIDEVLAVFGPLIEVARDETGCRRYELWQDAVNPRDFVVLQEWESHQTMDEHLSSERVQSAGFRLGELVEGAPEVLRYRRVY